MRHSRDGMFARLLVVSFSQVFLRQVVQLVKMQQTLWHIINNCCNGILGSLLAASVLHGTAYCAAAPSYVKLVFTYQACIAHLLLSPPRQQRLRYSAHLLVTAALLPRRGRRISCSAVTSCSLASGCAASEDWLESSQCLALRLDLHPCLPHYTWSALHIHLLQMPADLQVASCYPLSLADISLTRYSSLLLPPSILSSNSTPTSCTHEMYRCKRNEK